MSRADIRIGSDGRLTWFLRPGELRESGLLGRVFPGLWRFIMQDRGEMYLEKLAMQLPIALPLGGWVILVVQIAEAGNENC